MLKKSTTREINWKRKYNYCVEEVILDLTFYTTTIKFTIVFLNLFIFYINIYVFFYISRYSKTFLYWYILQSKSFLNYCLYLRNRNLSFIIYSIISKSTLLFKFYIVYINIRVDNLFKNLTSKINITNFKIIEFIKYRKIVIRNQDFVNR